jgi:hypothetical protein
MKNIAFLVAGILVGTVSARPFGKLKLSRLRDWQNLGVKDSRHC